MDHSVIIILSLCSVSTRLLCHISLILGHFVDDQLLKIVKLSIPLVQGKISRCSLTTSIKLQHTSNLKTFDILINLEESLQNFVFYLINFTTDGVVQDAGNQETLYISCINVQFSRDELDVDSGVGFDKLD